MIHSISLIAPRGNTISIKASGNAGPTLFLLHGFPLDHRMWLNQIEAFSKRFRVIVPELRGFGGSTVDNQYSFADLAADIELVRKHLAANEKINMIGLSMGGYVCFEYWRQHGRELNKLVLANTKPNADDEVTQRARLIMAEKALSEGSWAAAASMMDRLLPKHCRGTVLEDQMREMMAAAAPEAVAKAQHAMAQRADFGELLSSIQTETLVITGELDVIAPPDPTRQWTSQIPHSQYCEFSNAGHMTTMEVPDQFNEAVLKFLS
ncbi:MAG: alpha/beta hydrolase [Pirellulales bacterium]